MNGLAVERLSSSQAARVAGCSVAWIHRLASDGRLSYEPTPLGRLFSRDDVEALRREREERQRAAEERTDKSRVHIEK